MAKYCGLKKAGDLAGRKVRLTRNVRNSLGEMPRGTHGVILGTPDSIRNGHLRFKANACQCCGFQWIVDKLHYDDLSLAETYFLPAPYDYVADPVTLWMDKTGRYITYKALQVRHFGDISLQVFINNAWTDKYGEMPPRDIEESSAETTAASAIRKDNMLLTDEMWDWCEALCEWNDFTVTMLWDLVIALQWKLKTPIAESHDGWEWLKNRYAMADLEGSMLIFRRALAMEPLES